MEMRDDRLIKLLQLPRSDNSSLAASASSSCPPPQIRSSSSSHTCRYCKREFRSAQGLGGHMNVHRMDRARLIHHQRSSHRLSLDAASPPNPNHSRTVLDLLGSGCRCSRTHGAANDEGSAVPATAAATNLGICRFSSTSSATVKHIEVMKNLGVTRMGACRHGDGEEERLDLELRLGNF